MAEYVHVARLDELPPGERLVVEIRRRWVAIFNVDGQLYAIEDRCTHDDGPLAEGELKGCEIICPRHGARFDIRDGTVLSAPALVNVPSYEIRVVGEDIQIKSG
ncbi:MAG: non-heme iron oxygenase ferredoxin subunit [Anaerolineaceae bacterium]|nr:non-heme iron oxygenase ferredoxin subunit [Anaerolineaceae bacterium]MCY3936036.1 non-heme iron oxygenase ferredoxin subunit [Chloroflexota bacterium]MCY4008235.1 non-heme iron oxygenase ferredoxin subunit [Anaerolineaceae bacterium]MCY4105387.1 non-heme iron oxygenase ferredoxin subunit [Chloroflexota bacterium]